MKKILYLPLLLSPLVLGACKHVIHKDPSLTREEIVKGKDGLKKVKDNPYLNKEGIKGDGDGIHDLWVEAGGRCFQSFLNKGLLNRALIYVAPKILGKHATPAFYYCFPFGRKKDSLIFSYLCTVEF